MLGARAIGIDLSLGPGLSVKNALLYLSAILIAIEAAVTGNRKLELLSVIGPFGLLVLYALLTWIFVLLLMDYTHYSPRPTLIRLKTKLGDQFLMLLVFFYGVVNLKDAVWLLKSLIWVMAIGSLVTVVDTFNIPDLGIITTREDGRVEGILGSAQEFGALMAFFVPATVALWWTERGAKRALALFGVGLGLIALFLSASRGAIVGITAGSVLAAFYLRRLISAPVLGRGMAATLAIAVMAVVVLISTDFGYVLEERMTHGIGTGDIATLSSGRVVFWGQALREMMQYPLTFLTGFGWEAYYQSAGHHPATHSVYVDRLYNLGLIGLSLTIIPFVNAMAIARRAVQAATPDLSPYMMALVFGLVGLAITIAFSDIEALMYAWGVTGVALRIALLQTAKVRPDSTA